MTIDISTLLTLDTAVAVAAKGLAVAQALGLPVSTWRTGDPTKSLFAFLARVLAGDDTDPNEKGLGGIILGFGQAAFLSTATGDWLTVLAHEVYGVDRTLATYAATTVTLTNAGGGFYPLNPGDLTVKCSSTGQTYHSTTGGTLSAGVTLTLSIVADVAGSAGSAPTNGIDNMVTTLNGVVITASAPAVGVNQQSDADLRTQCQSTLGALSATGPADAYDYVLRNSLLTGVTDIARAKSIGDSVNGAVTGYVAGTAGPVAGASLTAGLAAVKTWATPLCITPTVVNGTAVTVNVTATIHGTGIPAGFLTLITTAIGAALSAFPIADNTGSTLDTTLLTAIMRTTIPQISVIVMSAPAAPVALTVGQYPVIGTVTITQV